MTRIGSGKEVSRPRAVSRPRPVRHADLVEDIRALAGGTFPRPPREAVLTVEYALQGLTPREALAKRNRALACVDRALREAGLGVWEGAAIGAGTAEGRFAVRDGPKAEALARRALIGAGLDDVRRLWAAPRGRAHWPANAEIADQRID